MPKQEKDLLAVKPKKPKKPQVVLSGAPYRKTLQKAQLLSLDKPKPGESIEDFWARVQAMLSQPSLEPPPGMKPLVAPPQAEFNSLAPKPLPNP